MLSAGFSGDALREDLVKSIKNGTLRPGTRISSFRSLAERYNVSLNTVQRVIGELVEARVLEAAHGRGTFVSTAKELCSTNTGSVAVFARASTSKMTSASSVAGASRTGPSCTSTSGSGKLLGEAGT